MFDTDDDVILQIIQGQTRPPVGFYRKSKNRKALVRFLVEHCLKRAGDERFYPLKVQDFKDFNLYGFLTTYYGCSPRRAQQEAYSEELETRDMLGDPALILEQITSKMIKEPPRGFWLKLEHRQFTVQFLISLLSKDIYDLTAQDFVNNGLGGFLSHYYQGSPNRAVLAAYPDAHPFLFNRINPEIWQDANIRRQALNYFLAKVPVGTKKITMKTLLKQGLKPSLAKFYQGDIKKLLWEVAGYNQNLPLSPESHLKP